MPEPTPPNPAPTPQPSAPAPTSADVVKGKVFDVIRKLETRISILEDSNKTLSETNKGYEAKLALLANTPSQLPGKSLLQELDEFIFPKPPQA